MAILGLGPRRYAEYVDSVRLEFTRPDTEGAAPATVSEFVTRRGEFLEGILRLQEERGRFYFGLHPIHEESLRDNVDRELTTLRG